MHICMYVYVLVDDCMFGYIHIYIYMYVYIHICMRVDSNCIYGDARICLHIYIYTYIIYVCCDRLTCK